MLRQLPGPVSWLGAHSSGVKSRRFASKKIKRGESNQFHRHRFVVSGTWVSTYNTQYLSRSAQYPFGQVNSAGDARIGQIAGKLTF